MKIIYPSGDTIAVVNPDGLDPAECSLKDVPYNVPFLFVPDESVPTDRTFRAAWAADFSQPDGYGMGAHRWFLQQYDGQTEAITAELAASDAVLADAAATLEAEKARIESEYTARLAEIDATLEGEAAQAERDAAAGKYASELDKAQQAYGEVEANHRELTARGNSLLAELAEKRKTISDELFKLEGVQL
jgi:hypothetical protein